MRISWNEFFVHPCVNLMNEVWGDSSQHSALSASYSELLRELESREREVDLLRKYALAVASPILILILILILIHSYSSYSYSSYSSSYYSYYSYY